MKDDRNYIEYYPSKKNAESWKAPWDRIRFDDDRNQWYLIKHKSSYNKYFDNLDEYLEELRKTDIKNEFIIPKEKAEKK